MSDIRSPPRRTNNSPIAAARIAAGLTQAQLAEISGIPLRSITRWETESRVPRADLLARLADALHVDMRQLIPQ